MTHGGRTVAEVPNDACASRGPGFYLPLGRVGSIGTVVLVRAPDWVLVRVHYRGHVRDRIYQTSDIRPYPPKRKWQRRLPLRHPS